MFVWELFICTEIDLAFNNFKDRYAQKPKQKTNWTVRNRTLLVFKICTYAKLNCLKWNRFCMLKLIVWNGTNFDIETVLTPNWIVWNRTVLTFNCVETKTTYAKMNC